jgi:hypothetical protein
LVATKQAAAVSIGIDPTNPKMQLARLDLGIEFTSDYTWFVAWAGFDAGSAILALGVSPASPYETAVTSYSPGWWGSNGFDGSYHQFTTGVPLSFILIEACYERYAEVSGPTGNAVRTALSFSPYGNPSSEYPLQILSTSTPLPLQIRADHAVMIPDTEIARSSGTLLIPAQTVTLTDIGLTTVAGEAKTLSFTATTFLNMRYASSIVVTRVSDGAILVRGTDYYVAPDAGTIKGLANTADFAVTVSYVGSQARYDLIYVDEITGVVGVANGTLRSIDPEEYRPTSPSGTIPLYATYFYRVPGFDVIELIPVHRWRKYVEIGREAPHLEWLDYSRKCLPKTFSLLKQGAPVRVAGFGDSNMYMGGSGAALGRRTDGDAPTFFSSQRIPADTVAALPTFTQDANTKTPINWPYFVKAAMERPWGSKVTYDNYGISGSGTGSTTFGGSNSARMADLTAGKYDLVIICLGTNTYVASELQATITNFLAAGCELILLGPPPLNLYAGTEIANQKNTKDWLANNASIRNLALKNNCAYVYTPALFAPGNEGATGLSQRSLAAADTAVHSGIAERRITGEYMALIFDGQIGAVPTGLVIPAAARVVPTTGFSITIAGTTKTQILDPAGTLATGTITMPAAPRDEQIVRVASSQTITALTVSPNAGQSIKNAPTTLAAGGVFAYSYDLATATCSRCSEVSV